MFSKSVRSVVSLVLLAALPGAAGSCAWTSSPPPSSADDADSVQRVLLLADLASALQHERATASLQLVGASAIVPDLETTAASRTRVDALQADVEPMAAGDLVGMFDDVTAMREAVDNAATAGIGPHQQGGAIYIYYGYGPITSRVLDLQADLAGEIGDPETRRGATLLSHGLEQVELLNNLLTTVLERYADPSLPADADWLSRVTAIRSELISGRDEVTESGAGTRYRPAIDELEASLDEAGYLDSIEVLNGEDINIASLFASIVVPMTEGWHPFIEALEDSLETAR